MTQSPVALHVCHPGLRLSAAEAQNLRKLIRRCRIALTAIHAPQSPSLLQLILPLGLQSLSILHGLLALSVRGTERMSHDLQHHQLALTELRREIQAARLDAASMHQVHRVLALCLLLSLFSLPQCDGSWVQHHHGMLSLIRSVDQTALASTPLGKFLLSICACQDISALSLGRRLLSRKAWLSWMLPRAQERSGAALTSLEATVGYPETLLDIIAQISEFVDDNYHFYLQSLLCSSSSHTSAAADLATSARTSDDFEVSLTSWTMPKLPIDMSSFQQLAVRLAWETMRKASLLFLWRNRGFNANLMEPMRPDKKSQADSHITDVISNVRVVFDLGRVHRFSVGNALLWAIAVVGCECTSGSQEQRDQVMALFDSMGRLYTMDHVENLRAIFAQLWKESMEPAPGYLSLEKVTQEMDMIVPLF